MKPNNSEDKTLEFLSVNRIKSYATLKPVNRSSNQRIKTNTDAMTNSLKVPPF